MSSFAKVRDVNRSPLFQLSPLVPLTAASTCGHCPAAAQFHERQSACATPARDQTFWRADEERADWSDQKSQGRGLNRMRRSSLKPSHSLFLLLARAVSKPHAESSGSRLPGRSPFSSCAAAESATNRTESSFLAPPPSLSPLYLLLSPAGAQTRELTGGRHRWRRRGPAPCIRASPETAPPACADQTGCAA